MKIKSFIVIIFSFLLVACTHSNTKKMDYIDNFGLKKYIYKNYSLIIPNGFKVENISNKNMDFEIYSLRNMEGKVIANLYFGNTPNTSLIKSKKYIFNNFKTISFNGKDKYEKCGNKLCGEILIELKDKSGWPQFLHIFFKDLNNEEKRELVQIIRSLSYR